MESNTKSVFDSIGNSNLGQLVLNKVKYSNILSKLANFKAKFTKLFEPLFAILFAIRAPFRIPTSLPPPAFSTLVVGNTKIGYQAHHKQKGTNYILPRKWANSQHNPKKGAKTQPLKMSNSAHNHIKGQTSSPIGVL